jgi:AraC family transcriptional regulator
VFSRRWKRCATQRFYAALKRRLPQWCTLPLYLGISAEAKAKAKSKATSKAADRSVRSTRAKSKVLQQLQDDVGTVSMAQCQSVPSAKTQANSAYAQRIDRVIDYLRGNLHRAVKLDELADVACFSEFHFHRIFTAVSGETLNNFTNRLRLEKAARLLRYSEQSLTDIALDCGFSSSATFSRAFRSGYDTSPRQFRKSGEIKKSKICKELFSQDEYGLAMSAEEKRAAFPVRLVDIPERQVAYIRVTNAFEMDRVLAALNTVIEWAKSQDVFSQGTLFGMTVDDPHVTPKHLYRYEVCLASSHPFECGEGMSKLKMPAMRYAVVRVSGDIHKVATAWDYLYRDWLINSAYEPEHAPALEVFLDKESATDWSHFELELCLPVGKPVEMKNGRNS